jgi:hypothetical protein
LHVKYLVRSSLLVLKKSCKPFKSVHICPAAFTWGKNLRFYRHVQRMTYSSGALIE